MTDLDTPKSGLRADTDRKRHPALLLLGMAGGLGVILVALLMVFIMPSLKSGPSGLPLGITGPSAAVGEFERSLEDAAPGAYSPRHFDSEDEVRAAILDRDVVGGLVLSDVEVHALVASAGSATISGSITGTAQSVGKAHGTTVSVEDVVPLPAGDPTGIGIGGLAFPLVFGGIVPVVAFRKIFPRGDAWYLGGLLTFAAVGGAVVAAILDFAFGSIESGFWAVTASIALGIAALAFPLAGLQKMLGAKGFTLGAMVMMFLGNPLSGIPTTAAWLPSGLGTFGQILPPGAAGTLVRSAAYFDGAGGLTAGLTLGAWIAVGLVLYALGMRRARGETPTNPSAAPVG